MTRTACKIEAYLCSTIIAVEMHLSKRVTDINLNSSSNKFSISNNGEQFDEAEAVIVTVPVPQVLTQLKGSIAQYIGTKKKCISMIVETVSVSSKTIEPT